MLKFSRANAKLQWLAGIYRYINDIQNVGEVYSLDLPAGYSCPGAKACKSMAVKKQGRRVIQDGPHCQFRCYAAMDEVKYPQVWNSRRHNFEVLKSLRSVQNIADAILQSLPANLQILRFHTSGDFFKQSYFDAALLVAEARQDILFYGYTKAIPFWIKRLDRYSQLNNFVLTASLGGRHDRMVRRHELRCCHVILNEEDAGNLPIDHDDRYASGVSPCGNFCLMIHGIQPAGSKAGKAVYRNRKQGKFSGYRKGVKNAVTAS